MKFGIVMFPTDYSIDPITLGRACEERGFDALFFPEHTHIPTSRQTPWPGGADLPREYSHIIDPFVALAAVAATTERLKLGTGICLVNQHSPITLAKSVASLDFLSGGRVLFGVGAGWNIEEMENHGADPDTRFRLMRESVAAMKEIWTKDEAEYHGRLVDFDPVWSWPKPAQQPHPPIYIGGGGKHTLKRVVDYGDAWMPIPIRSETPLSEQVKRLNEMAEEAGRERIPVTVYGTLPREEVIGHYADIGIDRCIFWLPASTEAEAMPQLDRYAEMAGSFAKAGA